MQTTIQIITGGIMCFLLNGNIYKGRVGNINMKNNKKCVMCGDEGLFENTETGEIVQRLFLAKETNELLCEKCQGINEQIKRDKYPHKL